MRKLLFSVIIVLLCAACSSLPKNRDIANPLKSQAEHLVNKAELFEKQQLYSNAKDYYVNALDKYILIDEQNRATLTKISIARQLKKLNQEEEYKQLLEDIQYDLNMLQNKQVLKNEFTLLLIDDLYQKAEYDSLLLFSETIKDESDEQRLRKHSWQLLAMYSKKANHKAQISILSTQANKAMNNYMKKKFNDITAISFAFYSLGYVSYQKNNADGYKDAIKYFNKAYEADRIDQNYNNLAADLYYIGLSYYNLNEYEKAGWHLQRSANIYKQLLSQNKHDFAYFYSLISRYLTDNSPIYIEQIILLADNTYDEELKNIIQKWLETNK